jgi:hypothetical protein
VAQPVINKKDGVAMLTYREQVEVFKDLVPVGPRSVRDLIGSLRRQIDMTEIPLDGLPGRLAEQERVNAYHCIYNEEQRLGPEDMRFRSFLVTRNEKSGRYFRGIDGRFDFLYVVFEDLTGYISSNDSRLFLELEFARGVSRQQIDGEGPQFRSLLGHLAMHFEEQYKI